MVYNKSKNVKGYTMTNEVWKELLKVTAKPDYIVSPRGLEVSEVLAHRYKVDMPAFITLKSRKVNVPFMFAEAAWILSGSNRLKDLTPFMKAYANFSEDNVFLRGAYGPKVVDQLGYIVDSIENDLDTRQAVLNIWRERPGSSKDIPCTLSMQFLVRDNKLNSIVTMRSQDVVLGYTYDVFTFSMVAYAVKLLLKSRGIEIDLGSLYVTPGSLHIYETHYKEVPTWLQDDEIDENLSDYVTQILDYPKTYEELISTLWSAAVGFNDAY